MKDFKYYAYDKSSKERFNNDTILSNLFKDIVPVFGMASTEVGEIVRAVNKIIYRYYNDGDKAFLNYGIKTIDSPLAYLLEQLQNAEKLRTLLRVYTENFYSDYYYQDVLEELSSCAVLTIENIFKHGRGNSINKINSFDYNTSVMYKTLGVGPYDEYEDEDYDDKEDY